MPMTKVSVGKAGLGSAHASYITRLSALDPNGSERQSTTREDRFEQPSLFGEAERTGKEPNLSGTLDANLSRRALNHEGSMGAGPRDGDPIWTWNAPEFLTGETNGTRPEWRSSREISESQSATKGQTAVHYGDHERL